MRATFLKRGNSRQAIAALSAVERAQLQSAGHAVIRANTLDEVIGWSDDERLGWIKLGFDSPRGQRVFEAWLLANGDDGVVFEPGALKHLDTGISQSLVCDLTLDRVELVAALQRALDAFEGPAFEEWSRSAEDGALR